MTFSRRRTRSGLPVAVILAILTAIVGGRLARRPAPIPVGPTARSAPAPVSANDASRAAAPAPPGSAVGFTSRQHLVEHFEKHGAEFPGLDMAAYLRAAQTLRDQAAGGAVLELRRNDGVITRFDKASGAFLAVNRDGTIRTFFRPNDGEAYFRRQASRSHGGGP